MADFIKEYTNYSEVNVPILEFGNITIFPNYRQSASFVLDGVTRSIGISIFNQTNNSEYLNGSHISNVANKVVYAIKTRIGKYIIFYVETQGIEIYLNDTPTIQNATYLYGSTGSAFANSRINIIKWNNYLFLNAQYSGYGGTYSWTNMGISISEIEEIFGNIESTNYSPTYGNASDVGGYSGGTFDNSSDTISIPTKPNIGVSNIGFVNVYCPSQNALVNLGSELFPDFTPPPTPPTSTDVATALQMGLNNVVDNISNFTNMFINSKLIDYVIDCHCIPVQPTLSEIESIKIGFKSFSPSAPKATVDYVDFDCGTLNIKEYYSNFIDYVGTKAKLYLPFVGFVPIENEYFQNGLLQVIYRFNIIDGSFMAYVLSSSSKSELSNSVIASYGGNACIHIPITGLNYSNMVSGIASGTVATIATASINKGLGAVTAVNSALNTLSSKPSMQSSNGYNSTSAYLGIRYPYLIIEREVSNFSELYTNENGLPCNITKQISELIGYIQMDNCHMETLPCMEEEKEMIQNLLSSGIIV